MTLDWATKRLLDTLSRVDGRLRRPRSIEDLRSLAEWLAADNGPGPSLESVKDRTLHVNGTPTARLRIFQPRPQTPAVVVYFPGPAWGWVAGTLDTHDTVCRKLAERTGCTFIAVEHRKAPEHPYPAAVDDARQALLWAEQYRRELPVPTPPLIVVGEGSGGTLAALVARQDSGAVELTVGSAVLISPCLDVRTTRRSYTRYGEDGFIGRDLMEHIWDSYLPNVLHRESGDAMPLRARHYEGNPPTVLLVAEHDPLRDEGHEYLVRLGSAGVATDRHDFAGQIHGFFGILALPLGERAFQAVIRHVRRYAMDAMSLVAA